MIELREIEETKERVILVGVQFDENSPAEESLDELAELARTAGAEVTGVQTCALPIWGGSGRTPDSES